MMPSVFAFLNTGKLVHVAFIQHAHRTSILSWPLVITYCFALDVLDGHFLELGQMTLMAVFIILTFRSITRTNTALLPCLPSFHSGATNCRPIVHKTPLHISYCAQESDNVVSNGSNLHIYLSQGGDEYVLCLSCLHPQWANGHVVLIFVAARQVIDNG